VGDFLTSFSTRTVLHEITDVSLWQPLASTGEERKGREAVVRDSVASFSGSPVHCITANVQNEIHKFNDPYSLIMAAVITSCLQ
jgi:hypothetical protein